MDEARALAIVAALANGVNPLTGEVFAVDSPYQSPEVIRALYCAGRALEAAGRRRTRGQGPALSNAGKPWTVQEATVVRAHFETRSRSGAPAAVALRCRGVAARERHDGFE